MVMPRTTEFKVLRNAGHDVWIERSRARMITVPFNDPTYDAAPSAESSNSSASRSARRYCRARHLPQCRERVRRPEGADEGQARSRHCRGARRLGDGGRVDHGQRLMGERPHPWRSVQGADAEHYAADRGSRHREVSRLRADARHRSGHGEAIVAAFGEATFDIIEASPDG